MICSHAEVLSTCRRIFESLGLGPGCELEPAEAVLDLEAWGLGGLEGLGAALPTLDGTPPRPLEQPAPGRLDAGGQSCLMVGVEALDLAVAEARRLSACSVVLEHCRDPWCLVPWAVRRSREGFSIYLHWPVEDGESRPMANPHGNLMWTDAVAPSRSPKAPVRVEIVAFEGVPRESPELPPGEATLLGADELERRRQQSLATGVEVRDELWAELKAKARAVLVPASNRSRQRGAGAEVDDSE